MIQRPASIERPPREPAGRSGNVRAAYDGLLALGWTDAEAGNLAARMAGLEVARPSWRIEELEGLLFIRSLVEEGRLQP